jgi:hypothetical protein
MPFIPNPTYEPAMSRILAITNGFPATVTTVEPHDLQSGNIVRLIIPDGYGMVQANQLFGNINVTGPNTFTIDIDTTAFDIYTIPGAFPFTQQSPQIVPMAELNSLLTNAVANILI